MLMKIRFNENGKGTYEFLTVAVTCLILSAILLFIVINNNKNEKFQVFRYNARTVGINAVNYNNETSEDIVYLYELIDNNLVTRIKNNFSGDKYCDPYESKVVFLDDTKKVTLRCGEYLIYNQDVASKNYKIYKVSDWSFDEIGGDNVDTVKVYALMKNGKNLLNGYYEEGLFIKLVADNYGDKYNDLESIKKNYKVVVKTVYRKRTLVS